MPCEYKAIFNIMNFKTSSSYPQLQAFLLGAGLLLGLMPVLSFILTSIGFVLGISITKVHLPILVIATLVVTWLLSKSQHHVTLKTFVLAAVFFIIIFVIGLMHVTQIIDTSYDGMWYHQEAVINFAKGWNPYKRMLMPDEGTETGTFYDNHYPKAVWIAEATVYKFTGLLESAKVYNVMLSCGLFFLSWFGLMQIRFIPFFMSFLLALLIGLNPTSIYQLYAFYVDGQLGASLMTMIILLVSSIILNNRMLLWIALLFFVYLANIKFTGLVYGVVVLVFYLGYLLWRKRSDFKYYFISISAAFVLSICLFGYPTYVTNTINNNHPLYPIMGPGSYGDDIAKIPQPVNFATLNRFSKFFTATFAEPMWCRAPLTTKPKRLFKPIHDPSYFTRADFEISGFGPYYAELFVGFLLALALLFFIPSKYKKEIALFLAVVVISTFVNSEAWYARYAPQFWLFGITLVVVLQQNKYTKYLAYVLLIGLMINTIFLAKFYFKPHWAESKLIQAEFDALKKLPKPAQIIKGWPITFSIKAKEQELKFISVTPTAENQEMYTPFTGFSAEWAKFNKVEMESAKLLP
jgi:hypothetical protein